MLQLINDKARATMGEKQRQRDRKDDDGRRHFGHHRLARLTSLVSRKGPLASSPRLFGTALHMRTTLERAKKIALAYYEDQLEQNRYLVVNLSSKKLFGDMYTHCHRRGRGDSLP